MVGCTVHVIRLSSTNESFESSNSYSSSSEDNTQGNPIIIYGGDGGIRALERARNWPCDKKGSFIVSMKKSFVEDDCCLLLPFKPASKYLRGFKNVDITLYVGNRPWTVMVKHNNEQYRLGMGWRAFMEADRFRRNNVCLFHLFADGGVYDVIIFKA